MNRNDLFSAIEYIDEEIIENSEVKRTMNNNRRFSKKTVMLVAVVCVLTLFATSAFATRLFGLRDALLGGGTSASDVDTEQDITLSGLMGSKEYMAAAEWKAFTESYDPEGAILAQVDDEELGNLGLSEKFMNYNVYTQEMVDKLDEITAKYGLTLHGSLKAMAYEDWNAVVGDFVVTDFDHEEFTDDAYSSILGGYAYDDGTFRYDGLFNVTGGRIQVVDYQFSRNAKGVFDTVCLNIGNIADYQEQMIVTDSGFELAAAISENKAVLITELDSYYVTINVMGGTDIGLTFDDLKDLANTFDFSVIASAKCKLEQNTQENADNEPAQDANEIADGGQGFIEVSREGVVEKIPVETVRVVDFDTTIATAPEYFTYSVFEGIDTFAYEAWEGGASVYYSVYVNNAFTAEKFADILQENYTDSYRSVMTEKTRVGNYDAVAVYCDGNNILPDYNMHYFMVPTDYGCIVIETQFTIEMYEGLYKVMRAIFDTLTIG